MQRRHRQCTTVIVETSRWRILWKTGRIKIYTDQISNGVSILTAIQTSQHNRRRSTNCFSQQGLVCDEVDDRGSAFSFWLWFTFWRHGMTVEHIHHFIPSLTIDAI